MKRRWKISVATLMSLLIIFPTLPIYVYADQIPVQAAQKTVRTINDMSDWANQYKYMDFMKMAREYDALLFDFVQHDKYIPVDTKQSYMPLGYWDDQSINGQGRMFGFPSYVGHIDNEGATTMVPGSQEAITTMAAVLSGMHAGVDKTKQQGYNLVEMMNGFYNANNGENFVLNRVDTATGVTFWYEIYPQILFANLYELANRKYEVDITSMRNILLAGADRWLEALPNFVDEHGNVSFDFTSYNFQTDKPYKNGRWTEPSHGGIAYLLYAAFQLTGEQKYYDGMVFSMDAANKEEKNPYYEVVQDFNPLMAAMMNFKYGKNYNVDKMLNWIFDGDSDVRQGWGVITGEWDGYQADGLVGSTNDGGGYGFLMNTYHLGGILAPLAKYDDRYSEAVAKWFLQATNSVRLMYPNELPASNQSHGGAFQHDQAGVIAYEAVRKSKEGVSPYAMGDPTVHGWGQTDYGLYGASNIGTFAAIVQPTNVERILQLDLNATDYFQDESFPQFLYYNPYATEQEVTISLDNRSNLFDVVTKQIIASGVSGEANIVLPAYGTANIIVLPADARVVQEEGEWKVGSLVIARSSIAINIVTPHVQRQRVSGNNVPLTFDLYGAETAQMNITAGNKEIYTGPYVAEYQLDTTQLDNGLTTIAVSVRVGDLTDVANIKLEVSNIATEDIVYEADATQILEYTPVPNMPATVTQGADGLATVTETNEEGDWGAARSEPFIVDFDKNPYLEIATSRIDPNYTVQIKFADEEYGQYILSNGTTPGEQIIDIKSALASYGYDVPRTGKQHIRIYLMANGKEAASFDVAQVRVYYNNSGTMSDSIFIDVDSSHWAKEAIEALYEHDIVRGISSTSYAPQHAITRADFVVMLVNALRLQADTDTVDNYTDVATDAYYAPAIGIARALEITTGRSDEQFDPKAALTRQDMIVFAARALANSNDGIKMQSDTALLDRYVDSDQVAAYAQQATALLITHHIVQGDGQYLFPNCHTTRAEAAQLIYRMIANDIVTSSESIQ